MTEYLLTPIFEESEETITGIRFPRSRRDAVKVSMYGLSSEEVIRRRAEIIKCCNSYPQLVEALKEASERLVTCAIAGGSDREYAELAVSGYRALLTRLGETP